jgi:hypothetical protein
VRSQLNARSLARHDHLDRDDGMSRAPVRHWTILLAAAVFCGEGAACAPGTRPEARRVPIPPVVHRTAPEAALQTLARARARWDSAHVTAYRYRLAEQRFAGSPPPVLIEVSARRITHVQDTMGIELTELPDSFTRRVPLERLWRSRAVALTVDCLFTIAERTIRDSLSEATITYDPALGFPIRIARESRIATDAGSTLLATGLTALASAP